MSPDQRTRNTHSERRPGSRTLDVSGVLAIFSKIHPGTAKELDFSVAIYKHFGRALGTPSHSGGLWAGLGSRNGYGFI